MASEQPDWGYVKQRLKGIFFSPVTVSPPNGELLMDKDVEVPTRDGTLLRANVYRPLQPGRYPVLISLHPYGKDNLPRKVLGRYRPLITYRMLRQTAPIQMSAYTGWEAPDPVSSTTFSRARTMVWTSFRRCGSRYESREMSWWRFARRASGRWRERNGEGSISRLMALCWRSLANPR